MFVKAGDDAETMTEKYGADMYIEGETLYTISGSTNKAYSTVETTFVHTGETVYVVCRSESKRNGVGVITAVDGSSYTVMVTSGNFIVGDSVSMFRDAEYSEKQRVGRGTIARANPTAVNGTGACAEAAAQRMIPVNKRNNFFISSG